MIYDDIYHCGLETCIFLTTNVNSTIQAAITFCFFRCVSNCIFLVKYDLGQKYQAPQVRPDWGSNSWPPDHDSTFHVTEMPALTTKPSVTSACFDVHFANSRWMLFNTMECLCMNKFLPYICPTQVNVYSGCIIPFHWCEVILADTIQGLANPSTLLTLTLTPTILPFEVACNG